MEREKEKLPESVEGSHSCEHHVGRDSLRFPPLIQKHMNEKISTPQKNQEVSLERNYFILVAITSAVLTYINVSTEYCSLSQNEEGILQSISVLSFFIIMAPALFYAYRKEKTEQMNYAPKVFGVFFLVCGPIFFSTMNRYDFMKQEFWEFSGVVNDKYVSSNHSLKSIEVEDVIFEGLPSSIWHKIEIGDNVQKMSCQGIIEINEQEYNYRG